MFIGYYSIANCVTLFGLLSSVTACFLAANGNFKFAVYMLFIACMCDIADGTLARKVKDRSIEDRQFGIQLDSICDVVSFGVTPCFMAFSFGFDGVLDVIIYGFFIVAGAIRLAYFNTLANKNPGKKMKYFRGVPIPFSTFVITVLFLLTTFIPAVVTVWFFRIGLLGLGLAYILNIKVKKPHGKQAMIILGAEVLLLLLMLIGDCKQPEDKIAKSDDNDDKDKTEESSADSGDSSAESDLFE